MRHDFALDDWEIKLVLRLRQIAQSAPGTVVHVDPAARLILDKVDHRPERLDNPPGLTSAGGAPAPIAQIAGRV